MAVQHNCNPMTPEQTDTIFNLPEIDDVTFAAIVKKRYIESDSHWGKKDNQNKKLKEIRDDNRKQYLSQYVEEQLIDDRYEEVYNDNRQFVAIRTLVPFVTGQITAPEVTSANKDDLSKLFASDFEQGLQKVAEKQFGKYKIRLIVQDLLVGQRVGIGKWRYDGELGTIVFERIDPARVTIGKRSKLYEEPDFIRHEIDKTPGDLIEMFPDKKQDILELFGCEDEPDALDEKEYRVNEDWIWLRVNGKKTLVVGWSYKDYVFGKIKDPNWKENGKNLIDNPMMPFVFFNLLNDGSGYIDQTSFTEQSKYSQKNYNKRGQVIAESARYGGTGVPIFAKGAITQKDASKVHFSPVQRVLLDTQDVSKAFTTWQQANLPSFIFEDMGNQREAISNIYGADNVFNGQQSGQKTATQDVLLRNQAEGRQSDLLDMIEVSMTRFYLLEAQLMYMYFDETKYVNFNGNDGEFISIAISQKEIAKNLGIEIGVKAGTSLPLDRAQKRATIMQLLQLNKIGTLTAYQELGLFDNPEKAFKQYVEEQTNAQQLVADTDDTIFDRDANEDLQVVIGGETPDERDDVGPEYLNFLNEYLLTDKYMLLQKKNPKAAARVSDFIDQVLAKAQRKANKLALQPNPQMAPGMVPPPMPGQPPQPSQPGMGGVPPTMQAPSAPPPQATPQSLSGAIPSSNQVT